MISKVGQVHDLPILNGCFAAIGGTWTCPAVRGPVLIEAIAVPYEPPMPASVTVQQAAKFAESLAKGEPNRKKIALTVLEDKVKELV